MSPYAQGWPVEHEKGKKEVLRENSKGPNLERTRGGEGRRKVAQGEAGAFLEMEGGGSATKADRAQKKVPEEVVARVKYTKERQRQGKKESLSVINTGIGSLVSAKRFEKREGEKCPGGRR